MSAWHGHLRGNASGVAASDESSQTQRSTRLTLEAAGITLIGVILSIGLTVGFGLRGDVWTRAAAGAGTAALLVVVVKLSSSEGAALRRAANWITRAGPRG